MERITLKDAHYRIIGYVDIAQNGDKTLRDSRFVILGYYKKQRDVTLDSRFAIIGRGDILTTLLR